MLDPLMDLDHAALLALMLGSTTPIPSLPSSSTSAGSLITPPLVPLLAPPAATVQLPETTIGPLVPPFQTSLHEIVAIPVAQAASLFAVVLPATPL